MPQKPKVKIFLIHFQPMELYPPAINLLNFFGAREQDRVTMLTTKLKRGTKLKDYTTSSANVTVLRSGFRGKTGLTRLLNYALFYCAGLCRLILTRPTVILYFESISATSAIIYKRYFNKSVRLMAHYHEYTPPAEYETGMKLVNRNHRMEVTAYPHLYSWISHTNPLRLQKFITDQKLEKVNGNVFHIMPNYPPRSWLAPQKKHGTGQIKIVHVGALGFKNMYLRETVEWMSKHRDKFSLDFWSHNIDAEALAYLNDNVAENIRFCGGCNYEDIPHILEKYDVGLVMYKPFSENTVLAVSNKVFEYLACGLDVWFSEDMTYTLEYARTKGFPKIIPVNFNDLDAFKFNAALDRTDCTFAPSNYFSENVYEEILKVMTA